MKVPYLIECQNSDCRFREYRLKARDKEESMMESIIQSGKWKCHKCESPVKFRRIKFKVLVKLQELFPNKRVIYTKLTEDKLLDLSSDLEKQPYVTDKSECD